MDKDTPIDIHSNRLGEVVLQHESGTVYYDDGKWERYFVWPTGSRRGYKYDNLTDAAKDIGVSKPCGCADFEGKERLGRMIERHPNGEIWKHILPSEVVDYYVWRNHASEAIYAISLDESRDYLGIHIAIKSPKTLPKSAYPQNQKGYNPHSLKK